MSDRDDETRDDASEIDPEGEDRVRDLLRGALHDEPAPTADVLRGVQKRLRERSRGKFYAEGWSTAKHTPVGTYLVTSAVMLAILLVVYATLSSLSGEPLDVENTPAPVQIVFPKR